MFNLFNRDNPAAVQQLEGGTPPLGSTLQYLPGREGHDSCAGVPIPAEAVDLVGDDVEFKPMEERKSSHAREQSLSDQIGALSAQIGSETTSLSNIPSH